MNVAHCTPHRQSLPLPSQVERTRVRVAYRATIFVDTIGTHSVLLILGTFLDLRAAVIELRRAERAELVNMDRPLYTRGMAS